MPIIVRQITYRDNQKSKRIPLKPPNLFQRRASRYLKETLKPQIFNITLGEDSKVSIAPLRKEAILEMLRPLFSRSSPNNSDKLLCSIKTSKTMTRRQVKSSRAWCASWSPTSTRRSWKTPKRRRKMVCKSSLTRRRSSTVLLLDRPKTSTSTFCP